MIQEPFAIARYPVTNLQYRRFVEAGGYGQREWWGDDGWAWRTGEYDSKAPDYLKNRLSSRPPEKRGEPFYWHDVQWNNPLAPVVGVSWFEARAYCAWLAKQMGKPIRLPTEEEWERAAGGVSGREYAWGNEADDSRLNCAGFWENKIGEASTTMVGQFPMGNTPEGLGDLSGNVWEWTDSWFEQEQVNRVLRGGSWGSARRDARCATRNWNVPDGFLNRVGFRILSPGIFLPATC